MNGAIRTLVLSAAVLAMSLTPAGAAAQSLLSRSEAARILALEGQARHEEACEVLRSDPAGESLPFEGATPTYRAMQVTEVPHAVCLAAWDKPDKEALEADCSQKMMEHANRRVQAMVRGEDFDEPQPTCPPTSSSVNLTIMRPVHDLAEEAVESLEAQVDQLAAGIDFELMEESHTVSATFDEWIEGVGDRAAWSSESGQLRVASDGVLFAVSVQVFEDPEQNKALAIELARRLGG